MKPDALLATAILGLATLTELNAVVTITRQPTNQWVSLGAHVTNDVRVSSTAPPVTFEWHGPAGQLLAGETNRSPVTLSLMLPSIQASQAGGYYVILSDADNQPVQSDTATITVDPTFIKFTSGPLVEDVEPTETCTWWDPDGDGFLDVYVHTVGATALLQSFYWNNGDGTFTKDTTNALARVLKRGMSGAVGDFDNDGDQDFYVGGNAHPGTTEPTCDLYRNDGNGVFTPIVGGPWTRDVDLTAGCTSVDLDQDGLLDIFVVNAHRALPCLYRQSPAGTFVKLTAAQVGSLLTSPPESYNGAWADYDHDGDPDLWFENSLGYSRLHRNDGHGFFTLATPDSFNQTRPGGAGMWGDYDNDGWLDLFVGGYGDDGSYTNALYRSLEGRDLVNVAVEAGVALKMSAWGSTWGDYDNDGWLDLFAVDIPGAATNVLFRNRGGGTFERIDVGSPIRDGDQRLGAWWVDCDNDGFLDLFMTCGTASSPRLNHLYRNNALAIGNTNHWLKIKLNGQASNRSGIGAKIRVKATIGGKEVWQLREMTGNGYSQTCPGLIAHFGLGDAIKADLVRVEWPSGNVQELTDVPAGQVEQAALTITEQVFIAPARPSASLGGSLTLTSSRSGATAWQWYHDGVALAGQTGQTLALSGISTNDAGRYSVVVTTSTGTFTNYVYLLVDTQFERIERGDAAASWGCAWGDYDNDGCPDLFVGEGVGTPGATAGLYRNDCEGGLIRVTPAEAGDIVDLVRTWQCGAWADYDNDGHLDLMVTDNPLVGEPQPALWRNLGNGHFADATDAGSFASDRAWGAPILGDFNRDGFLDLAVANAWDDTAQPDWSLNLLYFSRGAGTFRKVTEGDFVNARAVVWGGSAGDMDGDGDLDLLLGTDTGISLFENDGAGGLRSVTLGVPSEGTSCGTSSWADYDNDGRLDVFVKVYNDTSLLLHNEGSGQWTEIPLGAGRQTTAGMWADYDNDGDLDLFISRGQGITTTNLLYANNGDGTFTQVMLGSLANDQGRSAGCAWADYDNNGFQDLFVTSHAGYPEVLYRNHGNGNHWISFKLVGTASNRSAIGAKVRVQATIFGKTCWQMREIGGGNRHQNDLRPHFGLGDATGATTVRIEWPSGILQTLTNVLAGQVLTLTEHQAGPVAPPAFAGASFAPTGFDLAIAEPTAGIVYVLEGSTDLQIWTKLMVRTSAGGTYEWVDEQAGNQPTWFYRLFVP